MLLLLPRRCYRHELVIPLNFRTSSMASFRSCVRQYRRYPNASFLTTTKTTQNVSAPKVSRQQPPLPPMYFGCRYGGVGLLSSSPSRTRILPSHHDANLSVPSPMISVEAARRLHVKCLFQFHRFSAERPQRSWFGSKAQEGGHDYSAKNGGEESRSNSRPRKKTGPPSSRGHKPSRAIHVGGATAGRGLSQPSSHKRQRQQQGATSPCDVFSDYIKQREHLKPYQVAAKWNTLKRAVQSLRKRERQHFWRTHETNLRTLIGHTIQSANAFNGRSTATVTHSLVKILKFTDADVSRVQSMWNALLVRTRLILKADGFDEHSLSNLSWAYAKIDGGANVDGPLLDALAQSAELHVEEFVPQGLSNVSWAFATMDHPVPSLFDAIADTAEGRLDDFNPQDLSSTALAFAKLGHQAPSLFDAIATSAQGRLDDFNPQGLSNTALAFAKLGHQAPSLFDAIATSAQGCLDDFTPQGISNTVWAFVTLGHQAPSLFDAIGATAQGRLDNFTPQALSNTALAFATLNHESPMLFDAIARTAQERLVDFSPQGLANMVWAFATMNHESPLLFDAIGATAQVRLDEFKPQELSNTAWAFATMNHESLQLFDAIARTAQEHLVDFSPQGLANMAWAFATMNHESPLLFDAIGATAQARLDEFKPQELSNTAWAFATMNHESLQLFDAIARTAQERLVNFSPQGLANMAWAFAVFDNDDDNDDGSMLTNPDSPFAQALLSADSSSLNIQMLCQLHQYRLWCQEKNGTHWFPVELSHCCEDAFVLRKAHPSRFQRGVVTSLGSLPEVTHVEDEVPVLTEIGYSLDVVVVYQGERMAVEVDGPSHFVGHSQTPTGSTVLKHRQLRALEGWNLVSIPYWEWIEVSSGSGRVGRRQRYLLDLLNRAITR